MQMLQRSDKRKKENIWFAPQHERDHMHPSLEALQISMSLKKSAWQKSRQTYNLAGYLAQVINVKSGN